MSEHKSKFSLLLLQIPRTNDKKELAAEQMFAALHGILKPKKDVVKGRQETISFEIAAIGQQIRFYVWVPKSLQAFVEGQIYAQYPTAQISEVDEDYANKAMPQSTIYSTELTLTDNETIPIKSFPSFEVDPLAAITATFSKLEQPNEEMWVQVIVRPISDEWHRQSSKMVNKIKSGKGSWGGAGIASGFNYIGQALGALIRPPAEMGKVFEPSERDKTRIAAIEEKSRKLGYQVKIRIIYAGNDQVTARMRMQAMVGTFKQFNTTNLNGFQSKYASFDPSRIADYHARAFHDKGFILNIEELASLYHLPHTTVETPNIVWATTKTAEPPSTLPSYGLHDEKSISLYGTTNFRGTKTMFGLLRADRGRHVYILGQTGTGKSGLLELLTLSDIYYDQGFAVIDPHGDYASSVLQYIPDRRVEDVIYFNPADTEHPMGFNPLEISDSASKGQVTSELVGVLKRMFDSWGPRLEYILRFTILALLEYPNATMLDITRMLTEKKFRDDVISYVDDPIVKNFWVTEFASWNEKFASEAVAPVLNKVGAFTANPIIRNIIGQPKSTFNIRKIMDEGKILIVNLSRGLIGEDNAAILGAMLVTKIQLAAMSRADIPKLQDRRPFYLYVDEFQNFATDSFAVILSEARKYALNLTIANQYISQMEETVRSAVFGNVGTIITFRVSPDDSPFLVKYFEPQFEAGDLSNFHNRNFVTSMSINGEKAAAFSGTTLNIPVSQVNNTEKIIANSRTKYAANKNEVELNIKSQTEKKVTSHVSPQPTPISGNLIKTLVAADTSEKLTTSKKRRMRRKKQQETMKSEISSNSPVQSNSNETDTDPTILNIR
jgi:Type IV secretion-system coupling protein DNA-binding domain